MKKSEFIKQVLEHQENTVFTSEGTVEAAIDLFVALGMLAPIDTGLVSPWEAGSMLETCLWEDEDDS
jgi:hypothetical protein